MREPGIGGFSPQTTVPNTTYPMGSTTGAPVDLNGLLTRLRQMAQTDPQGLAQMLKDNPQLAQLLMQALMPQADPFPPQALGIREEYERNRANILKNIAR